jgi:hypothetical protein
VCKCWFEGVYECVLVCEWVLCCVCSAGVCVLVRGERQAKAVVVVSLHYCRPCLRPIVGEAGGGGLGHGWRMTSLRKRVCVHYLAVALLHTGPGLF